MCISFALVSALSELMRNISNVHFQPSIPPGELLILNKSGTQKLMKRAFIDWAKWYVD